MHSTRICCICCHWLRWELTGLIELKWEATVWISWGSLKAELSLISEIHKEEIVYVDASEWNPHILPTIKLGMNNTHTQSLVSYCKRALGGLIADSCSINPNYFDWFHTVMKCKADSIVWISGILIEGSKWPSVKMLWFNTVCYSITIWEKFLSI